MELANKLVAVFIDAENVNSADAEQIFNEASSYGDVIVKKIFGDWSSNSLKPWKPIISKFSIMADQQFTFVTKKNSSDISLIIQVMLALFEKNVDVFCLVSSDSDFTRVVQELRERGKKVVGMGNRKAIQSFVNAFSEYIYLGEADAPTVEVEEEKVASKPNTKETAKKPTIAPPKKPDQLLEKDKFSMLKEIIESLIEDSGKALYSQISNDMKNKFADFIPRNYGCRSLKELMDKLSKYLNQYKICTDTDGTTMFLAHK